MALLEIANFTGNRKQLVMECINDSINYSKHLAIKGINDSTVKIEHLVKDSVNDSMCNNYTLYISRLFLEEFLQTESSNKRCGYVKNVNSLKKLIYDARMRTNVSALVKLNRCQRRC